MAKDMKKGTKIRSPKGTLYEVDEGGNVFEQPDEAPKVRKTAKLPTKSRNSRNQPGQHGMSITSEGDDPGQHGMSITPEDDEPGQHGMSITPERD